MHYLRKKTFKFMQFLAFISSYHSFLIFVEAGCADIRPNIPSRISEDSGLGALNVHLNRKRGGPSLHLDIGGVSRASSFAGSINTLAATPTFGRKDGFVFFRETSSEK